MKNLFGPPENRERRLAIVLTGIAALLLMLFVGLSTAAQFHKPAPLTTKDIQAREKWQGALKKICAVHPDKKYCRLITHEPGTGGPGHRAEH